MTMIPKQTPAAAAPQGPDDLVQAPSVFQDPGCYAQHPISAAYPPMSDSEFSALVKDIRVHGQQFPIVLFDGQVLDGTHRLRACVELGRAPKTTLLTGSWEDALAYVRSANERRRHLTPSQLSIVAAKLTDLPRGRPTKNDSRKSFSVGAAAKMFNVGRESITRAKRVLKQGTPAEVAAVERGTATVKVVAQQIAARTTPRPALNATVEKTEAQAAPIPPTLPPRPEPPTGREESDAKRRKRVARLRVELERAVERQRRHWPWAERADFLRALEATRKAARRLRKDAWHAPIS